MSNLDLVLNDFYNCVNIHARYIDNNLDLVCKTSSPLYVENLIKKARIYEDINKNTLSVLKLTYYKNIHFVVMPILNSKFYDGYIIVGPFKSGDICRELDIPFKPFYCIDYIISILKNIVNENIFKNNLISPHVEDAIKYIHNNYENDIKIDDLCNELCINKSYFCRLFKKESGYTFSNFLNKFRIEKSKKILLSNNSSILDVAMSVGYNNHNYYSLMFKKYNNVTPLEYKNTYKI